MKSAILVASLIPMLPLSLLHGLEAGASFSSSDSAGGGGSFSGAVGISVGENYTLKPSDVIQVEIYQEMDLEKSVRIEADGTVALALVGKVKIAGMTVAQSQELITDLYNRDYLVDPQISVLVISFAPKYVRVLGMVGRAGKVAIPPDSDLTLLDAITECGGIVRLGQPRRVIIKRGRWLEAL